MAELVVNVAEKPLGYYVGGDYGRSLPCPGCARPAVTDGQKRIAGGRERQRFVHRLSFFLDRKNNPVMQADDVCNLVVR